MECASIVKHEGYTSSREIVSNTPKISFSGLEELPDKGLWLAEHQFELLMLDGCDIFWMSEPNFTSTDSFLQNMALKTNDLDKRSRVLHQKQ